MGNESGKDRLCSQGPGEKTDFPAFSLFSFPISRFSLALAAAALSLAVAAPAASAQTIPGEQDYRDNCAVCHGPTGKGDGEAVTVLPAIKPKDLTQLTKNNHGEFPAQEIYSAIDGRDNIAAHELGENRMPTWGVNWQMGAGQPNPSSEGNTRRRIQDLVSYIKTLQEQ
jgi:mono/diheme cytochrome c family protein